MREMKIVLLTGGNSSEREVALASAATIRDALQYRYSVNVIDVCRSGWFRYVADFDYAFVMIHGTPGEDGRISAILDMMDIPYSCCGVEAMVVTFNKSLCKKIVSGIKDINLAREIVLHKDKSADAETVIKELGLPLFVKPNASGSSCGVTKVKQASEFDVAVKAALAEGDTVLIEEAIAGREFACGVVILGSETISLPVTEIVSHNEFFDYEAKYTAGMSDEITPAPISAELTAQLQRLAVKACQVCGCYGVVRADFIVTPDGRPYLVEINAIPGMSSGSIIPKQLAAANISIPDLCDILIADKI